MCCRTRDREFVHRISVTSLFLFPLFPPAPPLIIHCLAHRPFLPASRPSLTRDNDVSRVRLYFSANRRGVGEGNRMPYFLVCARQCSVAPFEFACRQHGGRCGGATIVVSKREECYATTTAPRYPEQRVYCLLSSPTAGSLLPSSPCPLYSLSSFLPLPSLSPQSPFASLSSLLSSLVTTVTTTVTVTATTTITTITITITTTTTTTKIAATAAVAVAVTATATSQHAGCSLAFVRTGDSTTAKSTGKEYAFETHKSQK